MSVMPNSRTVPRLVQELASRYGKREALVGAGQRLSYAELQGETLKVARVLHQLKAKPGDKIGILMGNQPEWITVALAITSLGGVAVPMNTWATASELEYVVAHSDIVFLVAVPAFLRADYGQMLRGFVPRSERFPMFKGVLGVTAPGQTLPEGWTALFNGDTELNAAHDAEITAACDAVRPSDVALMLYTSGSTAAPKGVQLRHEGLIENCWNTGERQHITEDDRLWLAVSLFWGMASTVALWNLMTHGACIVLQSFFEPGEALRLIEAERCTVFYGTPNMVHAMMEHPSRATRDLSTLRTGSTAGTPAMMARAIALGVKNICNVYGLTETHGHTHMSDCLDAEVARLNTCGQAMPGVQQKVVGPDGVELPAGQVGELLLKGYITSGYYKQPELTAQSFDADGFFKTGDLVCLDEGGNLQFRGRLKELIKSGAINVSPLEVEHALMSHPAVAFAQVVGVPDVERVEIVAAAVVLRPGAAATEDEVLAHCRQLLAAYKVPRRVAFIGEGDFPLTTTGKIQKNQIAAKFFADAA